MRKWELSRRELLRGMGVALALPLLEQMMPSVARAQSRGTPAVRRLVIVFVPNGMIMPQFTPAKTGTEWELTPILTPLAEVKQDVLVLSGLANHPAYPDGEGPHVGGTGSSLTSRKILPDGKLGNGISVDQAAAAELGKHTRYKSLELGLDGSTSGACEGGFSCAYLCNVSWASETLQMSKETNPQAVFTRLFGDGSAPDNARTRRRNRSILDLVRGDADRLNARLGTSDRLRVEEYLSGIRELERRLDETVAAVCTPGDAPAPVIDMRDHTKAMLDLTVMALRCDLTRVVTFMLANGESVREFPFLGISGQHHTLSHHQEDPAKIADNVKIQTWEMEQFASLLKSMKATQDPQGGNLLDSSLVLLISEMGDPNSHDRLNMPVVLAGRAGGALTPGKHVRLATEQPLANLHITILNLLGIPVTRFGDDGTGPLAGL